MYDYLVVGMGLSGAVFAHEATLKVSVALSWTNGIILVAIRTVIASRASRYASTGRIFSIPTKRKC